MLLSGRNHVLNKGNKTSDNRQPAHPNLAQLPQIEEQATSNRQTRRAHQKQLSSSRNWNGRQQCACSASPVAPASQCRRAATDSQQPGCFASVKPNTPAAAQASRHAARAACQVSWAIARASACAKAGLRVGTCAPYQADLSAALQTEHFRQVPVLLYALASRRLALQRFPA